MATKNDITGDIIASKHSKAYTDNYDAIFRSNRTDHNNHLLHDPIDGFNTTSTLEDKENEQHRAVKYGQIRQGK